MLGPGVGRGEAVEWPHPASWCSACLLVGMRHAGDRQRCMYLSWVSVTAGVDQGTPHEGRGVVSTRTAADRLETTTTSVRALVACGDLDGYWERTGKRLRWFVYSDSLDRFLSLYGPLSGKRRRGSDRIDLRSRRLVPRPAHTTPPTLPHLALLEELGAMVVALSDRVSQLELLVGRPNVDLEQERSRRLVLEDALTALEESDELVARVNRLRDEAYDSLYEAHRVLRARVTQLRLPRTPADIPTPDRPE